MNFDQRQSLLRLVVEDVQVSGWNIQIRLRIPLDKDHPAPSTGQKSSHPRVSSEDRLRSLRNYGLRDGEIRCLAQPGHG